ncbi:MAG TPA: hypothetical protein VJ884_10745, partial [Salinibacter sp.]|nr:hypothetical protein [Salinibacter sp.]
MSIFGSRDDDPLLQGDPFAPDADDDPSDEEAAGEGAATEDANDKGPRAGDAATAERPDAPSSEAD